MSTAEESFYKNRTPDVFYNIAGDLRSFKKGKSFSFRNKKKSLSLTVNNPPPGAYDPIYPQSKKRIISMYAKRDSLIPEQSKLIPGPGAYNLKYIDDSFNKSTKRGAAFAQSERPDICQSITPGPGSYNVSFNLKTHLGKIARINRQRSTSETPGPASYSPQQLLTQTRHSLTMYSNRVDFSLSDTKQIGPGQYNCQIKSQTHYGTMGKSKRDRSFPKNPGPGQYDIPSTIGRIPKYYRNLHRKIAENGDTTIIKYSPQKTRQIKVNIFDSPKKNDEK